MRPSALAQRRRHGAGSLPTTEEARSIYGGLITVLLRLVFLLYAEDEALMPKDSLYGQHYSVSGLADRLRQERFEHQNAMERPARCLGLAAEPVPAGVRRRRRHPNYLPARHGELFDPDAYPFLEGREPRQLQESLDNLAISDDVVERCSPGCCGWRTNKAQRLSYRSLDVEQIGSVYEGIMGFTVEHPPAPAWASPSGPRAPKDHDHRGGGCRAAAGGARRQAREVARRAGRHAEAAGQGEEDLKDASTKAELCEALLDNRSLFDTPHGLAGSA
jgi:hypothetical protein